MNDVSPQSDRSFAPLAGIRVIELRRRHEQYNEKRTDTKEETP